MKLKKITLPVVTALHITQDVVSLYANRGHCPHFYGLIQCQAKHISSLMVFVSYPCCHCTKEHHDCFQLPLCDKHNMIASVPESFKTTMQGQGISLWLCVSLQKDLYDSLSSI